MASGRSKVHAQISISADGRSRGFSFVLVMVLVATTFAAYWPAIHAGYIWDDDISLRENRLIAAPDGLSRFWFTADSTDYWPLNATTFWIEWRIWGDNPMPYHVTNIALHALAAVVLWRVLKRLGFDGLGAFLGGLLFAVHPVTVESVAWITERKTALSMVLYLLSILAYLRFEDQGRRGWYALALLAAIAALLAKTSVVALPVVLLLLCWWRHNCITKPALVRTAPFFLISLILGLVTVWFQQHNVIGDVDVRPEGIASRIASVGWIVWFYLYKIVVPIDLAMIYPRWNIDGSNVLSYVPLLLLIACFVVLWRYRDGWSRGPLVAMASFVVVLAPVLGLVDMSYFNHSLVADHLQYPGMPGLMALIGGGMAAAWRWIRCKNARVPAMGVAVVTGIVFLALGVLTWRQSRVYRDVVTLWSHSVEINPRAWAAQNNLGSAYAGIHDYDRAIFCYGKAIEIKADYAEAYNNRCDAYCSMCKYDLAIRDCNQALEIKSDYALAYSNRGAVNVGLRDYDRAISDCSKAIEIKPDLAPAYNNRCDASSMVRNYELAICDCTKAIELKRNYAEAHNNRANAYLGLRDYDRALADCTRAIEIKPEFAEAYNNRGNVYLGKGDFARAITDYSKSLELNPKLVIAYFNRGAAYVGAQAYDRAISDYDKSIELKPDYVEAYLRRGIAHGGRGDADQAIRDYTKAIEMKPDYVEAYCSRGNTHNERGAYDLAIQDYGRAIQIKPDYADAYYNRAVSHFQLKKFDNAWADVKKCKQLGDTLDPDFIKLLTEASGRTE